MLQITTVPTEAVIRWFDHLRHMLGATEDTPRKRHGYRNRFCADIGDGQDYRDMLEMERAGLVKAGRQINGFTSQYFHATVAGCQAIGLGQAAIKRAMED